MTRFTIIFRSLIYYRRSHFWTLAGASISTAILIGALVTGDSIRHTLTSITLARLGGTDVVMSCGDRTFNAALADGLSAELKLEAVPVMLLNGSVSARGGKVRAAGIQVTGITPDFKTFNRSTADEGFPEINEDEVIINRRLARVMNLQPGDDFVLRVNKPAMLPLDAALASKTLPASSSTLTVKAIAENNQMGRFSLKSSQSEPLNIFMDLKSLNRLVELDNRANRILIAESALSSEDYFKALKAIWTLNDAGLYIVDLPDRNCLQLQSAGIFMNSHEEEAGLAAGGNPEPIITYLINRISAGTNSCPYSFVSGTGGSLIPNKLTDDEIMINTWLADDLSVGVGDSITLTYYIRNKAGRLSEQETAFKVRSILPMNHEAVDSTLMPDIPGMSDAGSCNDWDSGLPVEMERIRKKDEAYWNSYRGAPKGFITLNRARSLWENRFGTLTAIRYQAAGDRVELERNILDKLTPESSGYTFVPVRALGLAAGRHSVNFGQLFISLGFFIIVAALLLTALLFVFSVEQRTEETGTLLAIGYHHSTLTKQMLIEGGIVAATGSLAGIIPGLLFNGLVIHCLKTMWIDAVGTTDLSVIIKPVTIFIGWAAGTVMAILVMWFTLRKMTGQHLHELQRSSCRLPAPAGAKGNRLAPGFAVICLLGAGAIIALSDPGKGSEVASSFFTAGSLLMVAGLAGFKLIISGTGATSDVSSFSILRLCARNIAAHSKRSLTVAALLACGIFVVISVGANRHEPDRNNMSRSSGTGGFDYYCEVSIPVLYGLNSSEGRTHYGLNSLTGSISFVQFKVKDGDDASCLNLNRVRNPRLLACNPNELADRKAFTITESAAKFKGRANWTNLNERIDEHTIPGIADMAVIRWGLGMTPGDELVYIDEHGELLKIRLIAGLANSIFQGSIIVSQELLTTHYPSLSGTGMFLAETDQGERKVLRSKLEEGLADHGIIVEDTSKRLAMFALVENTYLSIFLVLGSLGVLLGTAGLGIVAARNILERKSELAVMTALGYTRRRIYRMLILENLFLLAGGLICGCVAAGAAVLPGIFAPSSNLPWPTITILIAGITLNGCCWISLAALYAIRRNLMTSLRNE